MKNLEVKSDTILKTIMDHSETGIVLFDQDGRCSDWNSFMTKTFGKKEEDVQGKKLLDIAPFTHEDFKKQFAKVLNGESLQLKYFITDAAWKGYITIELLPFFEEENKPRGGIGMIKPVLEESKSFDQEGNIWFQGKPIEKFTSPEEFAYTFKEILSQLNESEKIADMGSWEWEIGNDWMNWSKNAFKIFGYEDYPKTITGPEFFTHLLAEDRLIVGDAVEKLASDKKPFDIEHKVCRKDGKIIWVYCKGRILESQDGTSLRMVGVVQDITQRKYLEDSLRKANEELEERVKCRTKELFISEERFRLVSRATNDAIWDWDIKNNSLWWNKSFEDLFGYSQNDSGFDAWSLKIHPEDREKVLKNIENVIKNTTPSWSSEYRFLKSDGQYTYVLDRGYGLYDEEGKPYRMVGSMMDVTPLKNTQEELKRSNEYLRRINTDLDNFIYTASHDLKTPISNLEGLILATKDYPLDIEIKDLIEMMEKSTDRLKRTILDLTEITKAQKESPQIEELKISEIFEEVKDRLEPEIQASNAKIRYMINEEETLLFSKKNLKSILSNLLSNAIKYSSPLRRPEIKIFSELTSEYFILNVEDNGLGLSENQIGKIFSMFKRVHTHVEGSGIGLYIVKRTMENFGGKVYVKSKEGEGSCFSLYFPKVISSDEIRCITTGACFEV